jgi:hypothetical protein
MKIILNSRIDHLNSENKKMTRNDDRSTIAKLLLFYLGKPEGLPFYFDLFACYVISQI